MNAYFDGYYERDLEFVYLYERFDISYDVMATPFKFKIDKYWVDIKTTLDGMLQMKKY